MRLTTGCKAAESEEAERKRLETERPVAVGASMCAAEGEDESEKSCGVQGTRPPWQEGQRHEEGCLAAGICSGFILAEGKGGMSGQGRQRR